MMRRRLSAACLQADPKRWLAGGSALSFSRLVVLTISGAMLLAPAAYPVNAQAAIFSDDEARKAILDLRIRFEELRNQVQDLGKQIQALNTELKETQQVVQKKADGQEIGRAHV